MIIFLYGEDTYRSSQKLKKLKKKYIEKYTDTNLEIFEDDFDFGEIKGAITTLPFLAEKRLIIIKNIFTKKDKKLLENITDILNDIPEETILIFWEKGVPDKRTVLFKALVKERSEEFKKLKGVSLTKWIQEEALGRDLKIDSHNAEKLVVFTGGDLWQIKNEIEKIATYKDKGEITSREIDLLVSARVSINIFDFVDAIGMKNEKKSLTLFHKLLEDGQNEIYILTMIERQVKNLILVIDKKAELSKMQIAKELGLHPFVVEKALLQSRNYSIGELKNIYEKLAKIDSGIKTGRVDSIMAIDMFIKEVCEK